LQLGVILDQVADRAKSRRNSKSSRG
jgi:hypothetical protein